jgi:uncharacterized protein (UPF0261 family)
MFLAKNIVLIGTLDTKGPEFEYVKKIIESRGHHTTLVDVGILGAPQVAPNITRESVAKKGGVSIDALIERGDRGEAINVMMEGAAQTINELYEQGSLQGIISLGGSGGTIMATHVMRQLPVGVPKVMVSTVASGDTRPYVGEKDITMMYSVVDIAGINRISASILANAAGAICGMVETDVKVDEKESRPLIATSMFGVTTTCVDYVRKKLDEQGYEVLVFHATGTGGQAMEGLIKDGYFTGVVDITTTEIADELVGGVLSAGPNRLEAASVAEIPQVVSLGALDMVNFWAFDTVPDKYRSRNLYKHNANVTLMRTTEEENKMIGEVIATKLNKANKKTAILIPLRGVSAIDASGQPFYDVAANQALFAAIRKDLKSHIELIEVDAHINDPEFAEVAVNKLLEYIAQS